MMPLQSYTSSEPTTQADNVQNVSELQYMNTGFGSSSHVQQHCSIINPCLHFQPSSMLRIFAYLHAARHVGEVSYSDYVPFNTGDITGIS